MLRGHRWAVVMPLMLVLLLSACGEPVSDEQVLHDPVTIEQVEGTKVARLTLTEGAAERLDIQTAPVRRAGNRMVVPSGSVLVDPDGRFWVYTSPDPLVFIRHEIDIDDENGDRVFLVDGPPVGTPVVTVGVAELYGAESGIGY
jgi:redox-sensitive bicupin YhaK (pirin superfamily)